MALDSSTRNELDNSSYHEHSIIVYEDLDAFREIYCRYAKEALDNSNEVVVIATTYETPLAVRQLISDYGVDVERHEADGCLHIVDSVVAYSDSDVYGMIKLLRTLAARAQKQGKAGIFNLSDMGSFFVTGRENDLLTYELSIPRNINIKLKGFCCYHRLDFERRLSKAQQNLLLNHHARSIVATTFHSTMRLDMSSSEAA
ncbi:MAG TPA: MEDS domain-containing protein [Nitrososphaera sp.]|nr:MEDS domain-containing protein [Nitrososphaera sp.]